MGSPFGSLMADVKMNHVIDKALDLTSFSQRPNLFCCYVDHRFATFPNPTSIDMLLNNLDIVLSQIQFTKKLQLHNSLTFLDVFVQKTSSEFNTSTYHKLTKTSLQTIHSNFSHLYYKRILVNNLLHRSYSNSNSYTIMDSEFYPSKDTFLKNGYRLSFNDKMHPTIF